MATKRANSDSDGASLTEERDASHPTAHIKARPKACTQCGTTRTPQWREGPCGPKTLCNACGVKRVRTMKKDAKEAKSKKTASKVDSSGITSFATSYHSREQAAVAALLKAAQLAELPGQLSDSCHEESGEGEESSWRGLQQVEVGQAMGPEGLAAANLLAMSCSGTLSPLPSPTRLRLQPAQPSGSFLSSSICAVLEQASAPKLKQLLALRDQVEAAQRQAAAADAAVSSVARVLALKQAAAARARAAAAAAEGKLREVVSEWEREEAAGQGGLAKKIKLFR